MIQRFEWQVEEKERRYAETIAFEFYDKRTLFLAIEIKFSFSFGIDFLGFGNVSESNLRASDNCVDNRWKVILNRIGRGS